MKCLLIALFISVTAHSQTYYIVRHAEKESQQANMSSDVPLSDKGKQRAEALENVLKDKNIKYIFSTNTIRTTSTAQPTADYFKLKIETYKPMPDSAFINQLRSVNGNVLIVGHSNTVDDIVNMLCGTKEVNGDLNDSEYDNLFVIKKEGDHYIFSRQHYGQSSQ